MHFKLRAMSGEEGPHIAHIGRAGKELMRQLMVSRHIRDFDRQHKIRPRRNTVALHHGGLRLNMPFEGAQVFGALFIQCNFDDGRQRRTKFAAIEDGHGALNHAAFLKLAHPAQASGRRGMHAGGKRVIGQRCILLQEREDAAIEIV